MEAIKLLFRPNNYYTVDIAVVYGELRFMDQDSLVLETIIYWN